LLVRYSPYDQHLRLLLTFEQRRAGEFDDAAPSSYDMLFFTGLVPHTWNSAVCESIGSLQNQHIADLRTYRQAHQDERNRVLHWILVPVETASFLLITATVIRYALVRARIASTSFHETIVSAIAWTLGLISVAIGTRLPISLACLLWHVGTAHLVNCATREQKGSLCLRSGLVAWSVAWAFQVGIGHWIWEGNRPNVSNLEDLSWLAVTESVLIAWTA
jgi:uncharacterized membrane protein YGL010W